MKKNNTYLPDDEIDLGNIIKSLWKEKILILSISVFCGLFGFLFASSQLQKFKTEIKLLNPPIQLFERYNYLIDTNTNTNTNTINNTVQFISDFKLNFLSIDNVESFIEESRNLDNFKGYLKSKNITPKKYFQGNDKFGEVMQQNKIIPNKYFLVFDKNLDGDIFFNNYAEFTKKKSIIEFKKNLKLRIEDSIYIYEQALEKAKLINLENPILKSPDIRAPFNEPATLFYRGSLVLTYDIINLKKLLQKLENDQFNYNLILDKASPPVLQNTSSNLFFVSGLVLGFLLSLVIIFLKNILKQKL